MKICLGITGSIAAYRSADVVKKLVAAGHEVRCVLTRGGAEFVTEKVLETFSGNRVFTHDSFSPTHFATEHISLARWADSFLIYGASANFIARVAGGLGDDFLALQLLAFKGPVVLAPAMNPVMWENPLVTRNVETLRSVGYQMVGPIAGVVACGEEGVGHVATDEEILAAIDKTTQSISAIPEVSSLRGKRVLISAGPMRTALDPVRYVQNRSSGKMGLELARSCRDLGASEVVVLLGPVSEEMKKAFSEFKTAPYLGPKDYEATLGELFPLCDVFFSAAAVLDFESLPAEKKIERSQIEASGSLTMEIRSVPDIVGGFGAKKRPDQQVIAFAAESGTENEITTRAYSKMMKKSADAMIANPVWPGFGPEAEINQVWIIRPDQAPVKLGPALKRDLARPILRELFGHA